MFNNFNRIINRIRDNDQPRDNSGSADYDFEKSEVAEGFLCPVCMEAFTNQETLHVHFEDKHIEKSLTSSPAKSENTILGAFGFARPLGTRANDVESLKAEVTNLSSSLNEERAFSEQLRKEVERLNHTISIDNNMHNGTDSEQEKLAALQLQALEESKSLLNSEILIVKQQLNEQLGINLVLRQSNESACATAEELRKEVNELNSTVGSLREELNVRPQCEDLDRCRNRLTEVEDYCRSGEAEHLRCRNDLVSLEQKHNEARLQIQSLEQENSKHSSRVQSLQNEVQSTNDKLGKLKSESGKLKAKYEALSAEKSDLARSDEQEISGLRSKLQETRLKIEELDLELNLRQNELTESNQNWQAAQSSAASLQRSLNDQKERYDGELERRGQQENKLNFHLEETLAKLNEKESAIRDGRKEVETLQQRLTAKGQEIDKLKYDFNNQRSQYELQSELKDDLEERIMVLQNDCSNSKEVIVRMEKEKSDLYAQIHSGDDARNTAMEQLQEENKQLQQKLKQHEEIAEKKMAEVTGKYEGATRGVHELKSQLQNAQDSCAKYESLIEDLEEKIKVTTSKVDSLKAESHDKTSLVAMADSAKSLLKAEMEAKLSDVQNQLSVKNKELNDLAASVSTLNEQLSAKNQTLVKVERSLKTAKEGLKNNEDKIEALEGKLQEKANIELNLASIKIEHEKVVDSLIADIEKLTADLSKVRVSNLELEKMVEFYENGQSTCNEKEQLLNDNLREKDRLVDEKNAKVAELCEQLAATKCELSDVQRRLESNLSDGRNCSLELESKTVELSALRSELDSLKITIVNNEQDILNLKGEISSVTSERDSMNTNLSSRAEELDDLQSMVDSLTGEKATLGKEVLRLDMLAKDLQAELNSVGVSKTSVETQLFESQMKLSEAEELNAEMKNDIEQLHISLEMAKTQHLEDMEALRKSSSDLSSQVVTMKKELDTTKGELKNAKDQQKGAIDKVRVQLEQTEVQLAEAQSKLEFTEKTMSDITTQFECRQTRFDFDTATLRDNLATLKEDLASERKKSESSRFKMDEMLGEKLELEAKLENALDERRALLERCLSSESESEKYLFEINELRRKFEDTTAALQELGRENQSLQLETSRQLARKWEDDARVTHCTTCAKQFTVTIRKHHCRHCGNIFCAECSAKQAAIAANRKPVRVCDTCYSELSIK